VGAGVASETTAAATGAVGVVRRDSMAMKPFAGYNFGDYFAHWIDMGAKLASPPQIFHVNWFRQDEAGKYLWPGFGENLRVLRWIMDRCKGTAEARETPIGYLPRPADLDTAGLQLSASALEELLAVSPAEWLNEFEAVGSYLAEFADHVPPALHAELKEAMARVRGTA
jgi:phosphoenolpyruvate carboxykinase (GTP)